MMERSYDADDLANCMAPYMNETVGFEPYMWIAMPDNIALTDGNGNYNLFQMDSEGVYWAHTYYNNARGRDAIKLAQESLAWIFSDSSPVKVIKGLTPVEKKGACWLNRRIGLQPHGVLDTIVGPCELFILDKPTYERVK